MVWDVGAHEYGAGTTTSTSSSTSTSTTSTSSSTTTTLAPPQTIDNGRVIVASEDTTSTTPEDIAGLSTTVTLQNPGNIMAFMSMSSSVNVANRSGFFLIDIDGTNSPIIERAHATATDKGSIGVVFRSGTLPAGTYTVKGEFYVTASTTLTITNATLVAMCCQDDGGNIINSIYDTVTDSTD